MPPLPIETTAGLDGTLDVVPVDAGGRPITQIWDRTVANRLDCTLELSNIWAPQYDNTDTFELIAYFDPVATGGAVIPVPNPSVSFLGSDGILAAGKLTFQPPGVPECSIDIPVNDPILPAGPYRVTVVLTHTPDPADNNPRLAGFYDMGIIQLYEP